MSDPTTPAPPHPSWCLAAFCRFPAEAHHGDLVLIPGDQDTSTTGSAQLWQSDSAPAPRVRLTISDRFYGAATVLLSLRQARHLSRVLRELAARGRRS